MNADDLDAAYQKALPVINERIAAYQRDVASGELRDVFSALDGSGPMTEGRDPSRGEINDFGTVDCEQVVVCADDDSTARVSNEPNLGSESNSEPESTVDPHLSIEERCRQRWDLEETRAEFRDNYEAFLAYEKAVASGQVRFQEE
jgi:hypothetical protein